MNIYIDISNHQKLQVRGINAPTATQEQKNK